MVNMPDIEEISVDTAPKLTKQRFRKGILSHIRKNELASPQQKARNVIPNFKGTDEAAQRVAQLEEFKKAKVIKINPDKSQEYMRLLALEAKKEILVPIPRLKSGLFFHVKPGADVNEEELKNFASRRGLQQFGELLGFDCNVKVELLVLGAICVSREGYRIGKGEGFSDLEFAIMKELGVVDDKTTIITMVHDCQIVEDLPASLFEKYDVPVDIIVTPTQTIRVEERLSRPMGIYWEILTPRRVRSMQILQQLQQKAEDQGKVIALMEETSTEKKTPRHVRCWSKKRPRVKRDTTDSEGTPGVEAEVKESKDQADTKKERQPRKRRPRERKDDSESQVENNTSETQKEKPQRRRRYVKSRARANIDFSLKLSNIKSDVRVRHLKSALLARGVKASDISWYGYRGYCYLHFGKLRSKDSEPDEPVQVDSIVANLQHLKLGETTDTPDNTANEDEYIVVEPAKPITRIEITDVTAV